MNYSIKYLTIIFFALLIATACDVANSNDNDDSSADRGAIEISVIKPDNIQEDISFAFEVFEGTITETSTPIEQDTATAGESAFYQELTEGDYTVRLSSVYENCMIEGENPRNIEITAGETASEEFHIVCNLVENKVVFVGNQDGLYDMYIANADGTEAVRLTNDDAIEQHPDLSPDGSRIAYTYNWQIWTMDSDGSNPVQLTDTGENSEPVWSPDGEQIAFKSTREGDTEIYIMNNDGSEQVNLTNTPEYIDEAPSWSPDGEKIAFNSIRDAVADIFVIDVETGETSQITQNDVNNRYPSWSPDGSEFVLESEDSEGIKNLYTMDSNGDNLTKVTDYGNNGLGEAAYPSWSVDGYIYFTTFSNPGGVDGSQNASRLDPSDGSVSDIITDGDIRIITALKSSDKSTPLLYQGKSSPF